MNDSNASFVDVIPKPLIALITIAFAILTAFSILDFGVFGIFAEATQNTATLQNLVDLILCALFIIAWLRHDTRRTGRNFPLLAIITLEVGAFSPLLYLLTRKS